MEQGTDEWLSWRSNKLGASHSPVIMGVSPWQTRRELWSEKTGIYFGPKKPFKTNPAIEKGNKWEPAVRALYELDNDIDLPADILVHPQHDFIMASLDGFNKEHGVVLEIKVAGREVFESAQKGIVHEKYYPQVQHQLLMAGTKVNHFFVARVEKVEGTEKIIGTALVEVLPDEKYQRELLFELVSFWDLVQKKIPPPLTRADTVWPTDDIAISLFRKLRVAKDNGETIEGLKFEVASFIEKHIRHNKVSASGITMSKQENGNWRCTTYEVEARNG